MKTFEVAVPLKYCDKVRIEPSNELGELMVVYTFPSHEVYLRRLSDDVKKNVLCI
jgi:hypothetical protein